MYLHELGFKNSCTVLDHPDEIDELYSLAKNKYLLKVGLRMAVNEEPQSAYYTSRLGIPSGDLLEYYKSKIQRKKKVQLKMLHFFVDTGITDNLYYWGEFKKALKLYTELKKIAPNLRSINLGGGLPIRNNLGFDYDYKYIINEIVRNIKEMTVEEGIDDPDIFTEFGKYTVGESGAVIFEVLQQKQQNDAELWYIINNSLMNTIPDSWSILEKFILLPVNKWENEYGRVNIGGISCDHSDYYNSEELNQEVLLPRFSPEEGEPLYVGFFHTGAYQDAISGYGGIKHCLIPSPKHIIVDRDEHGRYEDLLAILGY